jgi:mRNA interferase MazF
MKDFDTWNIRQRKIEQREGLPVFHEREIWWCSIGVNIGSEQDGKGELAERPGLILKRFGLQLAWVIPLSNSLREGLHTHIMEFGGQKRAFLLSQLRLISGKRLNRRMDEIISAQDFEIIKNKIIYLINPKLKRPPDCSEGLFTSSSHSYDYCGYIIHPDISLSNFQKFLMCQEICRNYLNSKDP